MAVCYDGRKMDNLLSTQLGGGFHLHVSNTQLLRRYLVVVSTCMSQTHVCCSATWACVLRQRAWAKPGQNNYIRGAWARLRSNVWLCQAPWWQVACRPHEGKLLAGQLLWAACWLCFWSVACGSFGGGSFCAGVAPAVLKPKEALLLRHGKLWKPWNHKGPYTCRVP